MSTKVLTAPVARLWSRSFIFIMVANALLFMVFEMMLPTLTTASIPKERRGEGLGYFGVGETVAVSVGPLIGTAILMRYDFGNLFFGGAFILLLAVLMTAFISRKPQTDTQPEAVHAEAGVKLIERKVLFPSLLILLVGIAAGSIMSFIALYAAEKGFGAVFPAIQTWCVNRVGEHEHENAMASFFNFFDLGIGGAMILGLVASALSYELVYDVAIAVLVVYLLLYAGYAIRNRKKRV